MALFDTTHGTNAYGVTLGCFTGLDANRRTALFKGYRSLAKKKMTHRQTFRRVFDCSRATFPAPPAVLFTDGGIAMAAAARKVLPVNRHLPLCVAKW